MYKICLIFFQYVSTRLAKRMISQTAQQLYSKTLARHVATRIRDRHTWWKKATGLAVSLQKTHSHRLVRGVIHRWNLLTIRQKELKIKEGIIADRSRRALLSQVFLKWLSWAQINREAKDKQLQDIDRGCAVLGAKRLQYYWIMWRAAYQNQQREKQLYDLAASQHRSKLLGTALLAWHCNTLASQHRALLNQQAQQFRRTRLTATGWVVWRLELEQARQDRERDRLALWHWSLTAQKKALVAWCEYTAQRRAKKQQYKAATQVYRSHLLHRGVVQWLTTSASLLDIRQRYTQLQGTEAYFLENMLAAHAISQWQAYVERKRRERDKVAEEAHVASVELRLASMNVEAELREPEAIRPHTVTRKGWKLTPTLSTLPPTPAGVPLSPAPAGVPLPRDSTIDKLRTRVLLHEDVPRVSPRHPAFLDQSLQREGLLVVARQESEKVQHVNEKNREVIREAESSYKLPLGTHSPTTGSGIVSQTVPWPQTTLDTEPALIPPDAFLLKHDGTPIQQPRGVGNSPWQALGAHNSPRQLPEANVSAKNGPCGLEELAEMRAKLSAFKKLRARLKVVEEQHRVLQEWLSRDPGSQEVRQEAGLLQQELCSLQQEIAHERPQIDRLRAQLRNVLENTTEGDSSR